MSVVQRIKKYIDFKGITNQKFEQEIGYSNGAFATQLKKNKEIGSGKLENILTKYSDINPSWLLIGEGEMLKPQGIVNERQQSYSIGNVQEDSEGVPLIPIDAMAGFGEGSMQVMQYDLDRYKVPEFTELNVDFMIRVKGSSMYPKYNSGDLVACKKLSIKDLFFQWNKVYVLDTEQGALIKRIKKSDTDNCIKIVSDNPSYDPFDMPLDKIFAISIVVGVIRLE